MEKKIKLKTRQKFSTLDIKYQAYHIQQIISGCVVNNIYDTTAKSYLIKLGRAGQRENLFIDSGIRVNLTDQNLEIREKPNKFTQKLRKHIKNLFVDSVEQIGVERLFRIIFKGADKTLKSYEFHLYIELYAKGNIILTDAYDIVLACLREHKYTEEDVVQPQKPYPIDKAASYYLDKILINETVLLGFLEKISAKKNKNTIILNKLVPFAHQLLCDLWLIKNNILPNDKFKKENTQLFIELANQIKKIFSIQKVVTEDQIEHNLKGFLYKKKGAKYSFEFSPIKLPFQQIFKDEIEQQEFQLFNQAIEEHFKQFNIIKTEEEVNQEIEREALKKYQKIEKDQHSRVDNIRQQIELLLKKAQLIEYHQKEVQGIINIINELMQMGITNIMQDSIEQGKKEGDPLAQMIIKIKADTMKVLIELPELDNPQDKVQTQIDLKINAVQNAAFLYERRKKLIEKEKKTLEAIEIALKKARNLAEKEIENKKLKFQKKIVLKERKVYWFEKFYWFLTSENYLVITARDAQQNEILIKRYMDKNDIVFHAHIQGSAFTIIKNNTNQQISPLSINEVAVSALAHSKAWKLNVVVEVYWVYANQVSKTAPTGLSLPSGSFMIYGKKNFINPYKLEMGFGLLFKIDKESAKRHKGERRIKVQEISEQKFEQKISEQKFEQKISENQQQEKLQEQQQTINSVQQILKKEDENITQVQIQKKGKQMPTNKQRQINKKKNNKKQQKQEEQNQQTNQQQNKKNRKKNKKKDKKIKEYLEKFGDETQQEQEMRMKYLGFSKNQKFEQKKKEFDWNNDEVQIIKFEDENKNHKVVDNQNQEEDKIQNQEDQQKQIKQKEKFKDYLKIGIQDEKLSDDFFDNLTGKPLKDDKLISIYPVCAPYNTLNDYKYKVKLLPGNTKRGKAFKFIQQIFLNIQNQSKIEQDLIKFIPENQAIMQITGTSKVQGPGINKIKRQNKNKKKRNKKK